MTTATRGCMFRGASASPAGVCFRCGIALSRAGFGGGTNRIVPTSFASNAFCHCGGVVFADFTRVFGRCTSIASVFNANGATSIVGSSLGTVLGVPTNASERATLGGFHRACSVRMFSGNLACCHRGVISGGLLAANLPLVRHGAVCGLAMGGIFGVNTRIPGNRSRVSGGSLFCLGMAISIGP